MPETPADEIKRGTKRPGYVRNRNHICMGCGFVFTPVRLKDKRCEDCVKQDGLAKSFHLT